VKQRRSLVVKRGRILFESRFGVVGFWESLALKGGECVIQSRE
jgi:hypothetical protein